MAAAACRRSTARGMLSHLNRNHGLSSHAAGSGGLQTHQFRRGVPCHVCLQKRGRGSLSVYLRNVQRSHATLQQREEAWGGMQADPDPPLRAPHNPADVYTAASSATNATVGTDAASAAATRGSAFSSAAAAACPLASATSRGVMSHCSKGRGGEGRGYASPQSHYLRAPHLRFPQGIHTRGCEEEGDDGNVTKKRGTMERGLGILH